MRTHPLLRLACVDPEAWKERGVLPLVCDFGSELAALERPELGRD